MGFRTAYARERGRLSVDPLPIDLHEAARAFQKDKLLQEALGKELYRHLLEAHNSLWTEYTKQVHPWEVDKYLATYGVSLRHFKLSLSHPLPAHHPGEMGRLVSV